MANVEAELGEIMEGDAAAAGAAKEPAVETVVEPVVEEPAVEPAEVAVKKEPGEVQIYYYRGAAKMGPVTLPVGVCEDIMTALFASPRRRSRPSSSWCAGRNSASCGPTCPRRRSRPATSS